MTVISEREFQRTVTDALDMFAWAWWHTRPAMNRKGQYRTPTTAKGIPDLIALRGAHVLAIELKSDMGSLTVEQVVWLSRFAAAGSAWVLRPRDDFQRLVNWLIRPEQAPRIYGWASTGDDGKPVSVMGAPSPKPRSRP